MVRTPQWIRKIVAYIYEVLTFMSVCNTSGEAHRDRLARQDI